MKEGRQETTDRRRSAKILYVEDNPVNLALVKRLLDVAGYEVIDACNGLEGIRVASSDKPDLIIMDINLPDMDGYEASTKIKGIESLKNIPIVALTANTQPGDRERSLTAGCDGYIAKPIDVNTFVGEIEEYLKGKRERIEEKEEEARYLKEYSRKLVDSLERKIKELEELNRELEDKVAERTMDLERLNRVLKEHLVEVEEKNRYITELNHDLEIVNAKLEDKNRELEGKQRIIEEGHRRLEKLLSERTRQKRDLEDALKKLQLTQSQLLQSEKMASIGQLAAGVAHEINNPIGFINSNMTSLGSYFEDIMRLLERYEEGFEAICPDSEEAAAFKREVAGIKEEIDYGFLIEDIGNVIAETIEGTERVAKIVQDLKSFSHVDQAEKKYVDINSGIESTLNIVRHELKYKAEVIKEYGELPEVECYPQQLNQVFMNLLVNASQAIEKAGKIMIKTWSEGDKVFVRISDTGKGIPPQVIGRIFEPFFTTKPVGSGTGLGLSISYNIIRNHGGNITVKSEVGKGSSFTIEIPVRQGRNGSSVAP